MAIEQTEPQEKALIAAQFERATAAQPRDHIVARDKRTRILRAASTQ